MSGKYTNWYQPNHSADNYAWESKVTEQEIKRLSEVGEVLPNREAMFRRSVYNRFKVDGSVSTTLTGDLLKGLCLLFQNEGYRVGVVDGRLSRRNVIYDVDRANELPQGIRCLIADAFAERLRGDNKFFKPKPGENKVRILPPAATQSYKFFGPGPTKK